MVSNSPLSTLRVLIPDGEFGHTLKIVRCLVRSSLAETVSVHVGARGAISQTTRLSRLVAGFHPLPATLSDEEYVQALVHLARTVQADVLLPGSVEGNLVIARHRQAFEGVVAVAPLASEKTVHLARDKGRLAQFMATHDIPQPLVIPMRPVATLRERSSDLSFPVLLKATASGGGLYINQADDTDALIQQATVLDDEPRDYIVQSYVEGDDLCYCVLARGGHVLAHTIQRAFAPPVQSFSPLDFIEFVHNPHAEAVGRKLVGALQYTGVACIDFRYDEAHDALNVLEINPRFWRSLLGSLRAGVNFPELACREALNLSLPATPYDEIRYSVGELSLKHLGRTVKQGISLRNSCMAYGVDDPLPELASFTGPKVRRFWDSGLRRLLSGRWSSTEGQQEEGGPDPEERQDCDGILSVKEAPDARFASSLSPLRVLIPDGEFRHALKVVRSLAQSTLADEVSIHLCTGESAPRVLRRSRHVDGLHPLPENLSREERARTIDAVAAEIGAHVLFPTSVEGGRLIAQHRAIVGERAVIPVADPVTQQVASNKAHLVQVMEAYDIPHPPATSLHPRSSLASRLKGIPFPALVKPAVGEGGHHIYRFDDPEAVLRFARTLPEDSQEYIVQTYIEGTDIDMSVLAMEGEVAAFTIQQGLRDDGEDDGFGPPAFIEFLDDPQVESVGRTVVKALQFTGLAHIDLRYDASRSAVYVLEVNTRIWGSVLGSVRAGVNFPELACRAALGETVAEEAYENIRYAVGDLSLKRLGEVVRRGIPLRNSCMSFGMGDPLPDLTEFARLKWERIKALWRLKPQVGGEEQGESVRATPDLQVGRSPERQRLTAEDSRSSLEEVS